MSADGPGQSEGNGDAGDERRPKSAQKQKMTITTSAMLQHSENWTSSTEARMVVVRSLMG